MSDRAQLPEHPGLWRAGQLAVHAQGHRGIPTGYPELDDSLQGGGWPAGLLELLLPTAGIGELRLLMPALSMLSRYEARWLAWINPPFIPYAPALRSLGMNTDRILLIHPHDHKDTLWALERACRSAACSAVLAWPDEQKLNVRDTQRLRLAARQGRTMTCLFRPHTARHHSSMAELRLALEGIDARGEVTLNIIKRRGGWPLQGLQLNVAETTATAHRTSAEVEAQLELWRNLRAVDRTGPVHILPETGPFLKRTTHDPDASGSSIRARIPAPIPTTIPNTIPNRWERL